jgi:predicted O-methyltransferase YrrM
MAKILDKNIEQERERHHKESQRWCKTFLGIEQRHTYWMYKVIDEILNENQQIKGIIEIGTGVGGLSLFLALNCYERGYKSLLTYDYKQKADVKLFDLLNVRYIIRDVFNEKSIQEIKEYADIPIFLMCDGGNKPKEFNTFVPYLKDGSVIAAHDFNDRYQYIKINRGIRTIQIIDTIKKYKLNPIKESEWDSPPDYIKTIFYRKG